MVVAGADGGCVRDATDKNRIIAIGRRVVSELSVEVRAPALDPSSGDHGARVPATRGDGLSRRR